MNPWENDEDDELDVKEIEKAAELKLIAIKEQGKTRYTITDHDIQMLKDCGIEPFRLAPHVKRL